MNLKFPTVHLRLILKLIQVILLLVICLNFEHLRRCIVTSTLRVFIWACMVLSGIFAPLSFLNELFQNDARRSIALKEIFSSGFLCCLYMAPCVELLSFWLPSQLALFGPARNMAFILASLCAASASCYAADALMAWPRRKLS